MFIRISYQNAQVANSIGLRWIHKHTNHFWGFARARGYIYGLPELVYTDCLSSITGHRQINTGSPIAFGYLSYHKIYRRILKAWSKTTYCPCLLLRDLFPVSFVCDVFRLFIVMQSVAFLTRDSKVGQLYRL